MPLQFSYRSQYGKILYMYSCRRLFKIREASQCNLNDFNVDGSKVNIPYNLDYPTQLSFISPELIPGPILSTQAQ